MRGNFKFEKKTGTRGTIHGKFFTLPSCFLETENIQALRKNFQLEQFPGTKMETRAQSNLKPPKNFGKPFQTLFEVLFAQFGGLFLNIYLAGSPTERIIRVTTFFSAASSPIFPIRAIRVFTVGLSVFTVLVNSSIEIEYLAMTATANRSSHLSHSIAGDLVASNQNSSNPGSNKGCCFLVVETRTCDAKQEGKAV